ncbi:MAG: NADP-dependent phosphogluconate dehydrogenase [Erysipelotrichaceae bacterium]|nr:NADP-dependent phosphogluconate dehydrogenase [Erysipelotrichaceae bacterium]
MSDIGVIGLGVMGKNIALNMLNHGYRVSGYNRSFDRTQLLIDENIPSFSGFEKIEDFIASLEKPRRIFLMVPAGKPVDAVIEQLKPLLSAGDIIMDGGNSYFEDTNRRDKDLQQLGIHYFGVGVSGGEEGALHGPSIMPSGDKQAYASIAKILTDISAKKDKDPCCTYIGPEGSGHYVKMVHNGIEYADMQLLAETYLILKYTLGYTNGEIASTLEAWNQGEVQSYLVDITVTVLREKDNVTENDLVDMILDVAGNKGTGRWTSIEALRQEYNASLLTSAYQARIMSNQIDLRKAYVQANQQKTTNITVEQIHNAYQLAKTIAFVQGFNLYRDASSKYAWNLNLKEIASIFRAGCIIQAKLLQRIMHAYDDGADDLLLYPSIKQDVDQYTSDLKKVIIDAIDLPLPVFTAALTYINQLTAENLGANLIQGQRDFFGAHTYQRIDKEGFEHHEWGAK